MGCRASPTLVFVFSVGWQKREGGIPIGELHEAAVSGDVQKVRELLEQGADVDSRAKGGWMPLYYAAKEGHTETVRLLIEYGADVNVRGEDGDTPLHGTAEEGWSFEEVSMMGRVHYASVLMER